MDSQRPYPQSPRHRRHATYLTVVAVLATALTGGAVSGPVGPAAADPRDDARRARAAVARAAADLEDASARAQLAGRRLAETAAAIPVAQRWVIDTRGRVIAAQVAAESAARRADVARVRREAATARFTAAQAAVDAAHARLEAMAVQSYKTSNLTNFNLVVSAGGALDALDRLGYVDRVMSRQQENIDALTVARRTARGAQDEAAAAQRAADAARAEAQAALGAAQEAQRVARRAVTDLFALVRLRRDAFALARSERGATLARYAAARDEEQRIRDELRGWESRHRGPTMRAGARLLMPVHGWKSSGYGWRRNPVFGVWRMHAGIDLAAPGGAPIYSAADGTVMRAGWSGGYGKYTCVSHGRLAGRGVSTCYGHQSQIQVGAGQRVRRGQVIGRVGSTGASTGDHLHFEVRLNGDPRDPEGWLPGCLC